ncbi:DUF6920 family protein [Tropicimonas aquimaris]|uniref:DUF6920 family protein n=1 Tax=Tropicimonas aquimaris TaxID=914152 RepID=A0ABW3IUD8_9RHOB
MTERDIRAFQARIEAIAADTHQVPTPAQDLSSLPEPVQRYFGFVFPDGAHEASLVRLEVAGNFRRPQTDTFNATTAEQVIAIGAPALMFSATTPVLPGIWARAYDYFADGEMEMKAKVLSLFTVVDESETPALNVISLRRWLFESALFPSALLPGGPVRWEAIDESHARAIVEANGQTAAMVATFDAEGRMTQMQAEEDGDLATPYHGSGEHVTREDYRPVGGVMIPHSFVISRAAGGEIYPFFDAKIISIAFE